MTTSVHTVNISINSSDWRGQALSNFGLSPFIFQGKLFASIEGFIQGIKFPESDSRREQAFRLSGWEAKQLGDTADRSGAYWNGGCLAYGSSGHHQLIGDAIRARIEQSPGLQAVLRSTAGAELVHVTGHVESPTTSLPATVFLQILNELRAGLLRR
ncbi:hypothetical protein NJI34_07290 [Pseudomonas sp. S 311-6]|uniref:hypothetical protein n=1 Tax=Kerstersia gyiorum TaxID=206506 RepID=UPI002097104B|nr:hypothetical protein [Pseudomonas sp. S 311-6]